jgi:hypothetical protein
MENWLRLFVLASLLRLKNAHKYQVYCARLCLHADPHNTIFYFNYDYNLVFENTAMNLKFYKSNIFVFIYSRLNQTEPTYEGKQKNECEVYALK